MRRPSVGKFDDTVIVFVIDDDSVGFQFISLLCCPQEIVFLNAWTLSADKWQDEWAIGSQSDDLKGTLHLFLVHIYSDRVVNVGFMFVGAEHFSHDGSGMGAPLIVGLHFLDTEITGAGGENDGGNHRNGRDKIFLHSCMLL